MRGMKPSISTLSRERAAQMTADNKYGAVWRPGLYLVLDGESVILETRQEADALIKELRDATDAFWPYDSEQ